MPLDNQMLAFFSRYSCQPRTLLAASPSLAPERPPAAPPTGPYTNLHEECEAAHAHTHTRTQKPTIHPHSRAHPLMAPPCSLLQGRRPRACAGDLQGDGPEGGGLKRWGPSAKRGRLRGWLLGAGNCSFKEMVQKVGAGAGGEAKGWVCMWACKSCAVREGSLAQRACLQSPKLRAPPP